jgi:flagellar motor component MotA
MSKQIFFRLAGLVAVGLLFAFCFKYEHQSAVSFLDVPAALLVICVPPLVLLIFSSSLPPVQILWHRLKQIRTVSNDELQEDMESQSRAATSSSGLARVLGWSTNHPDQFVRYGARILTSRYQKEELAHLLAQKILAEDRQWQRLIDDVGFLAKTAPYNGMLATVIGMLNMLRTLEDFSRITTSVGLALFGTLYGLILFLMVYSPLQKVLVQMKNEVRRRNEMVARWFTHVAEKKDADFMRDALNVSSSDVSPRTPAPMPV